MAERLRLKAQTAEDIGVLSAMLQDAAVKVGDLAYLPRQRRLAGVFNRFRWEAETGRRGRGSRVRSGLHIEGVLKAAVQNVPTREAGHVMNLLAIEAEPRADGAATLTLIFSGFAAIRLAVECIDVTLEDLSEAWRARARPRHPERGNN